ncbi:putative protein TPRXL [Antechinus flavipes]|uniref:putative protein TPRXL n=1 Tax=Antechinus flavipes TaxID=38775 RepID=UPI0022366DFB|nr:putative protein TPRXL [Antechinus flavipes]
MPTPDRGILQAVVGSVALGAPRPQARSSGVRSPESETASPTPTDGWQGLPGLTAAATESASKGRISPEPGAPTKAPSGPPTPSFEVVPCFAGNPRSRLGQTQSALLVPMSLTPSPELGVPKLGDGGRPSGSRQKLGQRMGPVVSGEESPGPEVPQAGSTGHTPWRHRAPEVPDGQHRAHAPAPPSPRGARWAAPGTRPGTTEPPRCLDSCSSSLSRSQARLVSEPSGKGRSGPKSRSCFFLPFGRGRGEEEGYTGGASTLAKQPPLVDGLPGSHVGASSPPSPGAPATRCLPRGDQHIVCPGLGTFPCPRAPARGAPLAVPSQTGGQGRPEPTTHGFPRASLGARRRQSVPRHRRGEWARPGLLGAPETAKLDPDPPVLDGSPGALGECPSPTCP